MPEEKEELTVLNTIKDLKLREPFEPFRIVMASGDKYLIEDGENLLFMKSQLFYVSSRSDKFVFMRMNRVTAVEGSDKRPPARKRKSA